jgi:hypothetical protein
MPEDDIRFAWIEASLRYGGAFGAPEKVVYQEVFGVSEPSVSRHQARFVMLFESQLGDVFVKDQSGRPVSGRLELVEGARLPQKPVFPKMPSLREWLRQNLGGRHYIEADVPRRDPEPWVLRSIIKAIRTEKPVRIKYHSKSSYRDRLISPHALARVVGRMHVRAFDHERNDFGDFVLSRIAHVEGGQFVQSYVSGSQDIDWKIDITLAVKPTAKHAEMANLSAVDRDYGLDQRGEKQMRVKKAIAPYLIDEAGEGFDKIVDITLLS